MNILCKFSRRYRTVVINLFVENQLFCESRKYALQISILKVNVALNLTIVNLGPIVTLTVCASQCDGLPMDHMFTNWKQNILLIQAVTTLAVCTSQCEGLPVVHMFINWKQNSTNRCYSGGLYQSI